MSSLLGKTVHLLWVLLGLALARLAPAEIEQTKNDLTPTWVSGTLDFLREHGEPIPEALGRDDVVVLVRAGASFASVRVLAHKSVNSRRLAELLEATLIPRSEVLYSDVDDESVAVWNRRQARLGSSAGSLSLDLTQLLARLRSEGKRIWLAVGVYGHARAEVGGLEYVADRRSIGLYRASAKPQEVWIRTSAQLSGFHWALVVVFVGLVPTCFVTGVILATRAAKNQRIPVKRRRELYTRYILGTVFGSIGVHAPVALYLIGSRELRTYTDLWLGTASVGAFGPPVMMIGLVPFLFLGFLNRMEAKLFAHDPDDPGPQPQTFTTYAIVEPWYFLFAEPAPWLLLFFMAPALPGGQGSFVIIAIVFGVSVCGFAVLNIARKRHNARAPRLGATNPGVPILQIVDEIAERRRVVVRKVRIAEDTEKFGPGPLQYLDGQLSANRAALNELSPDEVRFGVASVLVRSGVGNLGLLAMMIPIIIIFVFVVLTVFRMTGWVKSDFGMPAVLGVLALPAVVMVALKKSIVRRQCVSEARRGLQSVRDASVALSYYRKTIRDFESRPGQAEGLFARPSLLSLRESAVKAAASELGLEVRDQ